MVPYSLLTLPLQGRLRWQQRPWSWPKAADQSVPDQPIVPQYKFRPGKFYQLLNRIVLPEIPADQSIPNQPILTAYVFRPGGYWQTQKFLLFPRPADQSVPDQRPVPQYTFRPGGFWQPQKFLLFPTPGISFEAAVPDQPILGQYTFRRGGFWQIQKFWLFPQLTDPIIVVVPPETPAPAPRPSVAHNTYEGSQGGYLAPERWRNFVRATFGARKLHQYDQAMALLVAGEITEAEFFALVSTIREYLAS